MLALEEHAGKLHARTERRPRHVVAEVIWMGRGSASSGDREVPPAASEFREDQYELSYPDGVENHWWHVARNRILAAELRRVLGPTSAVLDVGCGRGVTVKYLRERGIDCTGADLANARPLPGLEPYLRLGTGPVDLPSDLRRRFDVVLLLDVIEHLERPATFLGALERAFERLAHVIVTVPARPEVWSNYDRFYGHHRRYTLPMIDELAREVGWAVTERRYFFRATYVPARLLAALGRDREVAMRAPRGAAIRAHRLLADLFVLERHLLPRAVPGTSILARLQPRGATSRRTS